MSDDKKIDVNDINYAVYKLGNWKNDYEINQIGLSKEIPVTEPTITHIKFSMDEIRKSQFDISTKTVNGFVAIALQLNPKVQEMDLDDVIEYYNVTSGFSSIYEINSQRISSAQESGAHINTIQPMQLDGKNASDIIVENANGNFTRYISVLNNGNLYVFKIDGKTMNDITSSEIDSVLKTAHIE